MRTTIKQQMAAVKFAMKRRQKYVAIKNESCRVSYKLGHTDSKKFYKYSEDKNRLALNDAYSTLAAVALMQSVKKDAYKPLTAEQLANLPPLSITSLMLS